MTTSVDAVYTNPLEKAVASDEQLRETLAGRALAEALRAIVGLPSFLGHQNIAAVDANLFNMATRTRVWGLPITLIDDSPRELTIGAGALLVDAGAEAPSGDDSSFRIGLNLSSVAIAIPASDDLWHLLECRVINTDVSENRDILTNPATDDYTNTSVVKRKLKRLTFQITTGTGSTLPTPTAGWTPLYGFVIPTAGATIPVMSQVVDLRQSSTATSDRTENEEDGAHKGVTRVLSRKLATFSDVGLIAAQTIAFDFAAELDGHRLTAHTVDTIADITRFLSGGGAATASTWHYIYLSKPPASAATTLAGNACWGGRQEPIVSNCLVLLSLDPPRHDGRNSVAMAAVAPFTGEPIQIGEAVCVGALLQNAGATGWEPMYVSQDGHAKIASLLMNTSVSTSGLTGVAQGVTTAAILPINVARHVDLSIGMLARTPTQSAGGVGGLLLVTPCITGVTAVNNTQSFGNVLLDPTIQERYQFISAPLATNDLVADVGTLTYKVETRDATGVVYGANGLLSQVTNVGASLALKVVGFTM